MNIKKYLSAKVVVILLATAFLGFFDLPSETQKQILPFAPEAITSESINLGLDLQGGAQLDYKIVLPDVSDKQQEELIDGVFNVINKRVNGLGVAEPNIYRADIGDEVHIIVELAENTLITQDDIKNYLGNTEKTVQELTDDEKKIISLEKAKATVGKTIQLEFKEEKSEIDPNEAETIKATAVATLERIKAGEDFTIVGQEVSQSSPERVAFGTSNFLYADQIPESVRNAATSLKPGNFYPELLQVGGNITIDGAGNAVANDSYSLIKLLETKDELRYEKAISASHILIAYTGLESADASVTRDQEEAKTLANEIKEKLNNGEDFSALAKEYSNDPGSKALGGKLEAPVTGDGNYQFNFEEATMKLETAGQVSDVIETKFGYHIIKADEIKTDVTETQYRFEEISYSLAPSLWQDTGLTGKHFVRATVQTNELLQPYVEIQFDNEGAELFEEITTRNINKKLAMFVGGQLIMDPPPTVRTPITDGNAIIEGNFTIDEASALARDLNTGAIPAPIILTGERTIGATVGQEALNQSLKAGGIGLLLVVLFMLAYYKLPGLIASGALVIYGTILVFLIKAELSVGLAITVSLFTYAFTVYKLFQNEDSFGEKLISFLLASAGFIFFYGLLTAGVTLTLAGFAGLILSIGMAVDANILIFERLKEELRSGKTLDKAVDTAFKRAWTAIRDSNFSTLLTCAILYNFGSTIIQGFAFNLAAGIVVSMFTAITITKILVQWATRFKFVQNLKFFKGQTEEIKTRKFIKHSPKFFWASASASIISVLAVLIFGLNFGIDFKGGSLMELKFEEAITTEQLTDNLLTAGEKLNESIPVAEPVNNEDSVITSEAPSIIDFSKTKVIPTGENTYQVKTPYLTSESHDKLLSLMKENLTFTESAFTTIGATVGKSQLAGAVWAIIFALAMIILYVTFAFRKVPKSVNPWRFGSVAIIALAHDVLIVTGVFAILGAALNVEIDALFITAALTVFGYSVNDTIVVLDRLRENLQNSKNDNLENVADKSLSETMARSINTSLSTLLTLLAILFLGSSSIFYFILALTIGTFIGTYSSIFLATPLLVKWNSKK